VQPSIHLAFLFPRQTSAPNSLKPSSYGYTRGYASYKKIPAV